MNTNTEPLIKVLQKQFTSFEEIVEAADFNNGYYDHLEKNETCRKAIFAPVTNIDGEELILYWEGENQIIPGGKDLYTYFKEKGYEVVEKAHPSLLINAMKELTEERLEEMGIPSYVDVVLPTDETSLLPSGLGNLCFLGVHRHGGNRGLNLVRFDGEWGSRFAFLLRKMKS